LWKKIIEDLKSGKKDHEDFWIKMGEKYVYIRYFAVRNEKRRIPGNNRSDTGYCSYTKNYR